MTEKEKSELQKFIDGDYDGIPIDMEEIKKNVIPVCQMIPTLISQKNWESPTTYTWTPE